MDRSLRQAMVKRELGGLADRVDWFIGLGCASGYSSKPDPGAQAMLLIMRDRHFSWGKDGLLSSKVTFLIGPLSGTGILGKFLILKAIQGGWGLGMILASQTRLAMMIHMPSTMSAGAEVDSTADTRPCAVPKYSTWCES